MIIWKNWRLMQGQRSVINAVIHSVKESFVQPATELWISIFPNRCILWRVTRIQNAVVCLSGSMLLSWVIVTSTFPHKCGSSILHWRMYQLVLEAKKKLTKLKALKLYHQICGFLVVILLLNPTVHFWLHHTAQCGGWGHPQDGLYVVAARLSNQRAMVGTEWANSCPSCTNRPRKKHYSHLLGVHFQQGRWLGLWAGICQSRMLTNIACLLSMVKFTSMLIIKARSGLGFSFGVRARTEMEIWCILKVCTG